MFSNSAVKQYHNNSEKSETDSCMDCLIKELKKEDWGKFSEKMLLKIAYEKKIIKNIANSMSELNKEDKKNVEQILTFCILEAHPDLL